MWAIHQDEARRAADAHVARLMRSTQRLRSRVQVSPVSIRTIVRAYTSNIRPRARAELDWFRRQPDLVSAIERAALAINSAGKRYSHQRRLKQAVLEQARDVLLTNVTSIERCYTFGELFELLEAIVRPINGIGELYVYDTCLRIGAKLGLLPTEVYLHAGTRAGAKALGLDGTAQSLKVSALPPDLQQLEPYKIEDLLCIFKADLEQTALELAKKDISRRSWCG
jgi:hypothetical protein